MRYQVLSRYDRGWYSKECPVIIAAGAVLQDTMDNSIVLQLKLHNLTQKTIVCCKVTLQTYEINGTKSETVTDFSYLDISVKPGEFFGVKTPIKLQSAVARKFDAIVTEIVTEDSQVVRFDNAEWKRIPTSVSIDEQFGSSEYVKLFQSDTGSINQFLPQKVDGLYLCSCGGVNLGEDSTCYKCGKDYSFFEPKLGMDYIELLIEKKQEEERQELARRRQAAIDRQKHKDEIYGKAKTVIGFVVASVCIVLGIIGVVLSLCSTEFSGLVAGAILGIVGVVLSWKNRPSGVARILKIIGLILCVIAILINIIFFVVLKF